MTTNDKLDEFLQKTDELTKLWKEFSVEIKKTAKEIRERAPWPASLGQLGGKNDPEFLGFKNGDHARIKPTGQQCTILAMGRSTFELDENRDLVPRDGPWYWARVRYDTGGGGYWGIEDLERRLGR